MFRLAEGAVRRVKSSGLVNQIVRYNPRYYGEVRQLLRGLDGMDRERRRELAARLTARALDWARQTQAGQAYGASLSEWPVLERESLRRTPERYVVSKHIWLASSSAGATGGPLTVPRSLRCLAAGQAFIDDLLGVWDVTFASARIARLRNDAVKEPADRHPPFGAYRNRGRTLLLSSSHLSVETAPWFCEELHKFKPDVVYVHPVPAEALTRFVNELGLKLTIPLILSSSHALEARTRRLMEETFDATVVDYYNQIERVSFAAGVAVGAYYFNPAYGHVELEPVDGYEAPAGHRAFGIVATGFWNDAMPLVRYRTDDVVIVPDSYTASDLEDVTLGLKPVAAIRRRSG
jgi:phenylacetate-CoA ligase